MRNRSLILRRTEKKRKKRFSSHPNLGLFLGRFKNEIISVPGKKNRKISIFPKVWNFHRLITAWEFVGPSRAWQPTQVWIVKGKQTSPRNKPHNSDYPRKGFRSKNVGANRKEFHVSEPSEIRSLASSRACRRASQVYQILSGKLQQADSLVKDLQA